MPLKATLLIAFNTCKHIKSWLCPIIGVFYPQFIEKPAEMNFKSYQADPHSDKGNHHGNRGYKETLSIKDEGHVTKETLQVDLECC